jgi:organic radical activating enzyme
MEPVKIHLNRVKQQLDEVSSSYCVAKWQQVTIHLATGQTHSCHHPATHHIPLEEIAINPSALHNTKFKKEQRRKMLAGERPAECDYCWKAEDSPGDHYSDRVHKSADPVWGKPFLKESAAMPWDADVVPAYVEVSFSNVCNFGCAYCSPDISSTIMQEAKRFGPVKLDGGRLDRDIIKLEQQGRMPIPNREHNPYIDAFWAWWPTLYPKLKVFRITGGEPLMTKDTFKVLDWIIAHPNPELDLAINSNLGVDDKLLKEFLEKANHIQKNNLVKSLKIFTSCDTWGKQAEYIRTGLNYKQWYARLWDITLRYPALSITVMVTFNLLSIPRFESFLRDMLALRSSASVEINNSGMRGVGLDFPYLRHPRYLSSLIADPYMLVMLDRSIQFMRHNTATFQHVDYHDGFYPHEVENLQRVYNIASAEWQGSLQSQISRRDFYLYITEHDRRNATDFKTVFPEIAYFYDQCQQEYEDLQVAREATINEKEET